MEEKKTPGFDISSRVTIHDIHQVEVKLEYNLEELRKNSNYKIETYFFIPRSLQVEENTYSKEEFYKDLQNYIRFKTPSFSFKLILDPDFAGSPLSALSSLKSLIASEKDPQGKDQLIGQAVKEIKLLGTMMRARLRDFRYFVYRRLKKLKTETGGDEEIEYLITRLVQATDRGFEILERLRAIRKEYFAVMPEQKVLFSYFQILEEYVSYSLEDELGRLFLALSEKIPENSVLFGDSLNRFRIKCMDEKKKRSEGNFHVKLNSRGENHEEYIYYTGQFKKVLSSVLYLEAVRRQKEETYVHAVGAIAAFAASVLYVGITVFLSQKIAIDSLLFILFLSMGYVFKDRLKDLIKIIYNPRVLSRFPDHVTQLEDTSGNIRATLGEIREKAFFTRKSRIDPMVVSFRDRTRPSMVLPEESPENILVYQKEININTASIMQIHSRTVNLADIMRFNIRKYLLKMDDPEQVIHYYDFDKDNISTLTGQRTYHLNMVLKYSKFIDRKEIIKYERYRLVLNKWGILRVEFIHRD